MKKSKFTEAQIAFILRQAEEGTPVPGLPKGRKQRRDLLQLAQEVRRVDALGDEAVAVSADGDDVAVVEQPIADRCRDDGIADDRAPFSDDAVGGH